MEADRGQVRQRTDHDDKRTCARPDDFPHQVHGVVSNPGGGGLFKDKWHTHQPHEGPANDCANGQPRQAAGCPGTTAPVHEHAERQEDSVHGKCRRQIRDRGMEHSSAGDEGEQEEEGDARVHATRHGRVQLRLTHGASCREDEAQKVELEPLAPNQRNPRAQVDWYGVNTRVEPRANCIVGRVLPGLQAIAMVEVVRRLPIVESFITVLYR